MNSAVATDKIPGNLRILCTCRDSNQPPSEYQSEAYLCGSSTRNSARTTASLLMTLGMTDVLNVSRGIVILLGLIHIKYRLEEVGTAGPRCVSERHALIGWRCD
jgi:hypothetical protein